MKVSAEAGGAYMFIPSNISTETQLEDYIQMEFPYFSSSATSLILREYPPEIPGLYKDMTGRIALISGEALLNCPGYWLAQAFPVNKAHLYEWQSIHLTQIS
jgi:hypothetical protein